VKPGRPRTDRLTTVERVAELLAAEPDLSANAVAVRLGVRRQDAQRAVRLLRESARRFPNLERRS
jgi:hypothetical protein